MNCETVDELAAAYAIGAVGPSEEGAIERHLNECHEAHTEARALIDAAQIAPLSLDQVVPPPALRARLMTTVAATPQEHRAVARVQSPHERRGRDRWWRWSPVALAGVAAALLLVVAVGAWNVTLQQQLGQREAALRTVAAADAVHRVTGTAGSGWLLETGDAALFLAEDLAVLPQDRIYELWLIEADGTPVAVGTLDQSDGLVTAPLERPPDDATAFAVTVEAERVDAPTSEPVLLASLES